LKVEEPDISLLLIENLTLRYFIRPIDAIDTDFVIAEEGRMTCHCSNFW